MGTSQVHLHATLHTFGSVYTSYHGAPGRFEILLVLLWLYILPVLYFYEFLFQHGTVPRWFNWLSSSHGNGIFRHMAPNVGGERLCHVCKYMYVDLIIDEGKGRLDRFGARYKK